MATRQDQILQYGIDVASNKPLLDIAVGLDAIVAAGGPAAEQAQALQASLSKLASQDSLITNLISDKTALVDLGNQLFLAKEKAADLQATFDATAAPTTAMSRALDKANASVASLETQYSALSVSILKGSNALAAAGIDAENLDAAQRGLQASLAGVQAESAGLAASFDAASAAGEREALTMGEIADRSAVLRTGFDQLKTLLGTFAGILAFEKIKTDIGEVLDTGDKFAKWGQQFSAAFGGAEQGEAALAKVKEIADATPLSLDDVTKAALQAKKEGLDPFNGSLQALIDATVKFGGGSDQLTTLITTLGKSANTGGLNIRTLTALEQQGIPAAQLLGAAIGKTADQVTELARQGKLGADAVSELITALGKNATGSAADQFNLLSTQVTKAHDNYDAFLELIAQSGAYQFVVDQLKALNTEFKNGLESGSLQESAKAISDGLITLGQALISVTKFAVDHGAAIKEVVEDYALFKVAMLGVDLVGAAQKFLVLTDATKAAGAAAEAAAAGGGFGKLGSAIGAIPKNVQVAIALVGAEFAISETLKVVDTLTKITELQNQQASQQKDDAALAQRLATQAEQIAAQNVASAQTQIASADQLAQKNRQQSADYIASLQSAIKYFTAVQVLDKQLGDSSGAQAASQQVKALSAALQDATTHQTDLNAAVTKSGDLAASSAARFFDLNLKALSAAQAVAGIFQNVDFTIPKGLNDALAIIDSVRTHSADAGAAITTELAGALSKLNDADLSAFQANVTKKLAEASGNADALKIALGASLQEELLRLGLSAEQAGAQFTVAGQKIITAFTDIASNAQASGQQIQLAFAAGLSKLTTEGEVKALEDQLKSAFDAGKISADQFTAAMQAAGRKIADIQVTAVTSGASLDGMGTAGENAAQRIVLALEDARDKVASQAAGIAAAITAGLDAGSDVTDLKAKLATAEAAIADYNTKIAAAGNTGTAGLKQTTAAASQTTIAVEDTAKAADKASDSFSNLSQDGGDSLGQLDQALQNTRQQLLDISDAAAKAFDSKLVGDFNDAFDSTGIGFARVIEAMNQASSDVTKEITDQRTQLQAEIADINNLGTAGSTNFGQFGDSAEAAAAKMTSLSQLIASGNYNAGLLGQQELQPLQAALDAAAQRAQQLVDQVKQANDAFTQLASETQDALDQQEGNQQAIEDRRHQKELADLQDAAKAANQLNSQTYLQAVANENKLHDLKIKNLQSEQAAQNGSNSGGSAPSAPKSNGGLGSNAGSSNGSGAGPGGAQPPIQINFHGDVIGTDPKSLSKYLVAAMASELRSLQAKTTGPLLGK